MLSRLFPMKKKLRGIYINVLTLMELYHIFSYKNNLISKLPEIFYRTKSITGNRMCINRRTHLRIIYR